MFAQLPTSAAPSYLALDVYPPLSLRAGELTRISKRITLIACQSDEFCVDLQGKRVRVKPGELLAIGPGVVHGISALPCTSPSLCIVELDPREHGLSAELSHEGAVVFTSPQDHQAFCSRHRDARGRYPDPCAYRMLQELSERLCARSSAKNPRHDVRKLSLPEPREMVQSAQAFLVDNAKDKVSLDSLAQRAGLTKFHFARTFAREVGLSPHAFQLRERIAQAKEGLRSGSRVAEVASRLGFADVSHFGRTFKRCEGITPAVYARSHRAESLPRAAE